MFWQESEEIDGAHALPVLYIKASAQAQHLMSTQPGQQPLFSVVASPPQEGKGVVTC